MNSSILLYLKKVLGKCESIGGGVNNIQSDLSSASNTINGNVSSVGNSVTAISNKLNGNNLMNYGSVVKSIQRGIINETRINSTDTWITVAKNNVATAIGLDASQLPPSSSVLGMTGTYTTDANATAGDLAEGKTAYVNGAKVTGTLRDASVEGATIVTNPSTVRDDTDGGIAYDYTWTDSNAIVRTGNTFMMTATYEQVANAIGLTADRLSPGGYILDISGTYTSDATATAADIMAGETAYVNGVKVTGTMAIATSQQIQDAFNEIFGAA